MMATSGDAGKAAAHSPHASSSSSLSSPAASASTSASSSAAASSSLLSDSCGADGWGSVSGKGPNAAAGSNGGAGSGAGGAGSNAVTVDATKLVAAFKQSSDGGNAAKGKSLLAAAKQDKAKQVRAGGGLVFLQVCVRLDCAPVFILRATGAGACDVPLHNTNERQS